jgi:RND family efflux transporter MFP subunit
MKFIGNLWILSLAGLMTLTGCKPASTEPAKDGAPPALVQAASSKHGPITRSIALPGEVKAYQQATLYAKVTGYLKTITVDKGDQVKAGALLAEIEVPELLADRAQYNAEVTVAELDYNRQSESAKKAPDLVAPQTVDDAKGRLDIARANLERTETLLNFAKITAPFSGIITKRMVDPGAFIPAATAGSTPQSAAILTIADFSTVRVQVAVPEVESSLVATGETVRINVDGLPGRSFDGKITRFSYALDDASKTMLAEIELPNPKLELRPGMYATVKIGIEQKSDALLIPVDALVTERAGTSVFILADGKAKKIPVKTGFNDGVSVEIASGLKPDASVILVGKRTLNDGQPVQIGEAK